MKLQLFLTLLFTVVFSVQAESASSSKQAQKITVPAHQQKEAQNSSEPQIIRAVALSQQERVKEILQSNPEQVNAKDSEGGTPLLYAVSNADYEMTKLLLEAGASLETLYSDKKEHILFEAARLGSEEITQLLLDKQSGLIAINIDGETPLFESARFGQSAVAKLLIKKGYSKTHKNKKGQTAFDIATDRKFKKTAEILKIP